MNNRSSLAGRLLTAAVAFLVAAAAVVYAVHLILSVWVPLVVIGGVVLLIAALVAILRHRRSGW